MIWQLYCWGLLIILLLSTKIFALDLFTDLHFIMQLILWFILISPIYFIWYKIGSYFNIFK